LRGSKQSLSDLGLQTPSLFNIAELFYQPAMRGLRPRQTPTVPGAPAYQRPSIRRRIA
jgi:hypothetical protein